MLGTGTTVRLAIKSKVILSISQPLKPKETSNCYFNNGNKQQGYKIPTSISNQEINKLKYYIFKIVKNRAFNLIRKSIFKTQKKTYLLDIPNIYPIPVSVN